MAYETQEWVDKTASTPGTKINRARMMYLEQGVADAHALLEASGSSLVPVSGSHLLPTVPSGALLGYRVTSTCTFTAPAPDFSEITLEPGAYVLEHSPGGWVVLAQINEGSPFLPPSSPTVLSDNFQTARANLYGTTTPTGGAAWFKALWSPLGLTQGAMTMKAESGSAVQASGIGAGAGVATGWLDMSIEVDYDVTAASNAEVTVWARGDYAYTSADRSVMPVRAKVTGAGNVLYEPYFNGTSWVGFPLGSGAPTTGTLRLDVIGDEARVYVNGGQVGAARSLDAKQQIGAHAGMIVAVGGLAAAFTAARV